MPNIIPPQFTPNSVPRRYSTANGNDHCGGVRQDNPAPQTDRVASPQPALVHTPSRSLLMNTRNFRSQKTDSTNVKLVPYQTWINPLVKAEILRIAERERVSASKVGAAGLEDWIHRSIRDQHEALLYPIIRQVIREELRAFGDRIVHFLMRIAVAIEGARILIANVLDRMLIDKPDVYTDLLHRSDTLARQKVLAKIPHIQTLVEKWNAKDTEKEKEEIKRAA